MWLTRIVSDAIIIMSTFCGGKEERDLTKTAEKLVALRGDKSQAQVAKDLNISDSALSAYELGLRTPRDEVKKRIAQYYGVTVGFIFFEDE